MGNSKDEPEDGGQLEPTQPSSGEEEVEVSKQIKHISKVDHIAAASAAAAERDAALEKIKAVDLNAMEAAKMQATKDAEAAALLGLI